MNALAQPAAPVPSAATVPLLRTLVLCDLVDSTAMVERMGDQSAADLFRKHDRYARGLVQQHGGKEIDKTDGFLLMFERPIQAVAFALDYQRGLKQLNEAEKSTLASRVGIHVGDVLTWDNSPDDIAKGAKQVEVEGLVKPITSRLMQLALPNQVLLSGVAHSLAHRAQGELGTQLETVRWRTHGRYRFKGIPDPIPVFEVGDEGHAPLKAPPWSGKAHREVPFWRRPMTMGIEIGLLLILLAIPAWYLLKPERAIAFANRDWVVVGDLKNLTGQASFDESIDAAFRIGLEQSRYVNVLSDLKTRETIQLMQQDPNKIKVDRAIGSEIALRDGARALILPTIAEIGGRVRVTAEVIDPNTQTTVYSESADGVGADSVLPSLDQVNQKLRVRLGEALATVSNESRPLDKVATKNLDALRAYSLAERTFQEHHSKDAISLYREALKLDPGFALARIGIARALASAGDNAGALRELDEASSLRDRLSARDSLYVDAWRASLAGPQRSALEKWKILADLYPSFFTGPGLYAYFSWIFANDFSKDTIQVGEKAVSLQNARPAYSHIMLGMLYLGNERYADAAAQFTAARASGLSQYVVYPFVDAAQRRFEQAATTLSQLSSSGLAGSEADMLVPKAAIAFDRGNFADAWSALGSAKLQATGLAPKLLREFEGVELSLRTLVSPEKSQSATFQTYAGAMRSTMSATAEADRAEMQAKLLFLAYLAAREPDAVMTDKLVAEAGPQPQSGDYPLLSKLSAVVQAQRAIAVGKPAEAIQRLKSTLDGNELYLAHVVLQDAYAATKNSAAALAEARWLSAHRGRAYAEWGIPIAIPYDVAQSNLALMRAAEFSSQLGDKRGARAALQAFQNAWPNAGQAAPLALRITNLQKEL